jgi:hypothetical protein
MRENFIDKNMQIIFKSDRDVGLDVGMNPKLWRVYTR